MHRGYIKLWRKTIDNFISSNPEALALWVHLLLLASHKETEFLFNGKKQILQRGQFITGRKKLHLITGISESKIFRLLKCFENEQLIEQQNMHKFSLICIKNYDKYQNCEQQNEQPVNSKRTASEQLVNTFNNDKNDKNDKNVYIFSKPTIQEISDYCKERNNSIDADKFFNYYESSNWFRGKTKIKDWRACVRTWEKNNQQNPLQKNKAEETLENARKYIESLSN